MNTELAILIKETRTKNNLSQRELARKIGIDNATISRIENGSIKKPAIDILIKLSNELNIDINILLNLCEYNVQEILKLITPNKINHNMAAFNFIDKDKLQEYLSLDGIFEYIDILKVLNGFKNEKLTPEETIGLILCCSPGKIDHKLIYPTENKNIEIDNPFYL